MLSLSSQENDGITVSRTFLRGVLDSIERASRAAYHAGRIGTQAREAFDAEADRLNGLAQEVRRSLDRI